LIVDDVITTGATIEALWEIRKNDCGGDCQYRFNLLKVNGGSVCSLKSASDAQKNSTLFHAHSIWVGFSYNASLINVSQITIKLPTDRSYSSLAFYNGNAYDFSNITNYIQQFRIIYFNSIKTCTSPYYVPIYNLIFQRSCKGDNNIISYPNNYFTYLKKAPFPKDSKLISNKLILLTTK